MLTATPYRKTCTLVMAPLIAIALQVGTGGEATAAYYKQRGRMGYPYVAYDGFSVANKPTGIRTPVENLAHIRAVLKPTVAELAKVLGVSRQAIYDWQTGNSVSAGNALRLADLAQAADVFASEGLTTTSQILRRPIAGGSTLFDIVRKGGSAAGAARSLILLVRRELEQRKTLEVRLTNRKLPAVSTDDYGIPRLHEQG